MSGGLEAYYVKAAFAWLLADRSSFASDSAEFLEAKKLILGLWTFEAWRLVGHIKEDGDYDLLSQQLGYDVVAALAHMALSGPIDTSSEFWSPVLELGPKAHYAIGHFLTEWFSKITEQTMSKILRDAGDRWSSMCTELLTGGKAVSGMKRSD